MDPDQRLVSRDGQPIPLTPKEYDTLLVLVEAGGKVVGKETLIARVWPDSYVGDGSLARNISVLRKALGGDVIENLPRVGYRFALPVASVQVPSHSPEPAKPLDPAEVENAQRPSPWLVRRFVFRLAGAACLLIALLVLAVRFSAVGPTAAHSLAGRTDAIHSVFIQKINAIDPVDEGFKPHVIGGFYANVVRNRENQGYDRWRIVSNDEAYYYRTLTDAEKGFALSRDWKLTCVCALEKGLAHVNADFGKDWAPRFDIEFLQEGSKYYIALTKQISPEFEWETKIEFPGIADIENPHTYELRYEHLSRTASLWIDGQLMASGYHGHDQYREDTGLDFGTARYGSSDVGIGVFRTVRFEAY